MEERELRTKLTHLEFFLEVHKSTGTRQAIINDALDFTKKARQNLKNNDLKNAERYYRAAYRMIRGFL